MPGNKRTAGVAAAVAAVLAIAALSVVLLRDGGDLDPGFVADGTSGTPMVHDAEIRLPIGTVRLSTGEPLDRIAARRVGEDGDGSLRASDDAAIVPLSWSFRPSLSYQELLAHPTEFSLSVAAGGERSDLGEQDVDPHSAKDSGLLSEGSYVAVVAGSGEDLALEVTYAGETQSVDMSSGEVAQGRAEALYPDGPTTYASKDDCDARRTQESRYVDAGSGSIYCRVEPLTRTPYLPDLGWAEAGRVWSVVGVTVTAPRTVSWIPTGVRYQVRREPITVSLSNSTTVRAPRPGGEARVWRGTWIFDSPLDAAEPALRVTAAMTAVRAAGGTGGPATIPFGVDQTFSYQR